MYDPIAHLAFRLSLRFPLLATPHFSRFGTILSRLLSRMFGHVTSLNVHYSHACFLDCNISTTLVTSSPYLEVALKGIMRRPSVFQCLATLLHSNKCRWAAHNDLMSRRPFARPTNLPRMPRYGSRVALVATRLYHGALFFHSFLSFPFP